jgi:hypothetical protein
MPPAGHSLDRVRAGPARCVRANPLRSSGSPEGRSRREASRIPSPTGPTWMRPLSSVCVQRMGRPSRSVRPVEHGAGTMSRCVGGVSNSGRPTTQLYPGGTGPRIRTPRVSPPFGRGPNSWGTIAYPRTRTLHEPAGPSDMRSARPSLEVMRSATYALMPLDRVQNLLKPRGLAEWEGPRSIANNPLSPCRTPF